MAIVIVALLMPTLRESISTGTDAVPSNFTNAGFITLILTFWPVFFILFLLFVLIIIIARGG